jgi:acetyl esterase/lipase
MSLLPLAPAAILLGLLAGAAQAQEPRPILLWPNGAPGSERKTDTEAVRLTELGEHIISHVHHPTITPYLPAAGIASGAAVIVIPGGGHRELWMDHEGYRVGRWLADHGIAAFVLKYRLAREDGSTYTVEGTELADVQRALRLVRSRSAEWHIAPDRIGVMGFSAGGELALLAGTHPDSGTTPAFMGLIYPAVPRDFTLAGATPPAFLLVGEADSGLADPVAMLHARIRHAGGSAELHTLAGVGHGFGIRSNNASAVAIWPTLFYDWLEARHIVSPGPRAAISLTPNAPYGPDGAHLSFWKPSFVLGTASGGEAGVNFWGIYNEGHVNVGFTAAAAQPYVLDCRLHSAGPITWKIFAGPTENPVAHGEAPLSDNHFVLTLPPSPGGGLVSVEIWPTPATDTLRFLGCDLSPVQIASSQASRPVYLYLWAGDSAQVASDFLAVIDATPGSPNYGGVLASLPVGESGTHPHHTEATMPSNGHLLANGFHAGRTFLFDLTQPTSPRLITAFGDKAGFSHPHTYVRLADGNVLATFQYKADGAPMAGMAMHGGVTHETGGLVWMDERGTVIRSGNARDPSIADSHIYPYSVLPMPETDRAVSTTTDMDDGDTLATAQWIQLWRLSDLKLLSTIELPRGPRGDENQLTGEPFLLPDGGVYIHTFMCGLYLLRDVNGNAPTARLVYTFEGKFCGVPILTGHYWLATVPFAHALVALDISDPEHPRPVSSVTLAPNELPHWAAIDSAGRRVVLSSASSKDGDRLYLINFDRSNGALSLDMDFHDRGDSLPGIKLAGRTWPHGFSGHAVPHGTVFSR